MNRLIEKYGIVAVICVIAMIILAAFKAFGIDLYQKAYYEQFKNAQDMQSDIKRLGQQGKYPFFVGNRCIKLTLGYQGTDGRKGFSREDALSFVEAYEYKLDGSQEIMEKVDKSRIKVYPFDDETESTRKMVDVENTGKYAVRYCVEGESGLKSDMIMMVLVDILPEGMEYKESEGVENESSG